MQKETISGAFTGKERSLLRSWCWIHEDAAEILDTLRAGPPGTECGLDVLWKTKNKYTLRLKTASGLDLACKWYAKIRQMPYSFAWTQASKEAYNFRLLANVGLPLVKMVATGEDRSPLHIRTAFIVTEFADGFLDGRCFFESMSNEIALRDEFTHRNFILVARMHDAGFYHRGFTPMNELWRMLPELDADGNRMEIRWIDIATCHRAWGAVLKRHIVDDLGLFLWFYPLTAEERRDYLRVYLDAAKVRRFDLDTLHRAVEAYVAEKTRRKKAKAEKKRMKQNGGQAAR